MTFSFSTGVSIHLASLHNQPYDLTRIMLAHDEVNDENAVVSSKPEVVETGEDGGDELAIAKENGEIQPAETYEFNDSKLGKDYDPSMGVNTIEMHMKPIEDLAVAVPISSQLEHPQNLAEIEIDGGSSSIAGAVTPAFPLESDHVLGDIGDISAATVQRVSMDNRSEMDAQVQMDEPLVSSNKKRECGCVAVDTSMMDGICENINNDNDDTVNVGDFIASVETVPSAREGISVEVIQSGATVETARDTDKLGLDYNAYAIEIENMDGRRVENNDQGCDGTFREQPSSVAENVTLQASSLHEGDHPMQDDSYLADIVDAEISGIDMHDRDVSHFDSDFFLIS